MFVFASNVWAADISGTWALKMTGRQGPVSMDLVIKATGENLTIDTKHPMLGDMKGTGTLKDNAITMNIEATGERKVGYEFKGTVTDNKMAGTREIKMSGRGAPGGAPGGAAGGGAPPGGAAAGGAPPGGAAAGGAPPGGAAGRGAGGGRFGGSMQNIDNTWTAEKTK